MRSSAAHRAPPPDSLADERRSAQVEAAHKAEYGSAHSRSPTGRGDGVGVGFATSEQRVAATFT